MNAPVAARPTDHRGLAVLGFDECLERLRNAPIGRLGFVSAGESVILPVNHVLDGDFVIFRTRPGSKLDVADGAGTVAYEVDSYDESTRTGWSVLVKGTAEVVYDRTETLRYSHLGLHPWADHDESGQWVRIRASEITGRRIGV